MLTADEVRELLRPTGYVFEARIQRVLERRGYYVEPSPYIVSKPGENATELDLIARKAFPAGPSDADLVFAVLLIECKQNAQPWVVPTRPARNARHHYLRMKYAGFPAKVRRRLVPRADWPDGWSAPYISLPSYLRLDASHPYTKARRVGTHIVTFSRDKRNGWIANYDNETYSSVVKLRVATEEARLRWYETWDSRGKALELEFFFPVLVLAGSLMEARTVRGKDEVQAAPHLTLLHSAATREGWDEAQIDVLQSTHLEGYLDNVERWVRLVASRAWARYGTLEAEMRHLRQAASRVRTGSAKRDLIAQSFGHFVWIDPGA